MMWYLAQITPEYRIDQSKSQVQKISIAFIKMLKRRNSANALLSNYRDPLAHGSASNREQVLLLSQ
jgi:hypothetical protein